jgi:hypothetical protein
MLRRPMRTQNLPPVITAPLCGQMMYTSASFGAGVGPAIAEVAPDTAMAKAARLMALRMLCVLPENCRPENTRENVMPKLPSAVVVRERTIGRYPVPITGLPEKTTDLIFGEVVGCRLFLRKSFRLLGLMILKKFFGLEVAVWREWLNANFHR